MMFEILKGGHNDKQTKKTERIMKQMDKWEIKRKVEGAMRIGRKRR